MDDDIDRAVGHAAHQPKVIAQVVVSLFEGNTTNLTYTGDEVVTRFLLSKATSILDWQISEKMRQAQADAARIVTPNGAARRLIGS